MTKARLLDEDEAEQEFEPTIVVNEEFAKRFEYNKRREELHRLQEKHPELAARLARKAAAETARAARQASGGAAYEEDEDEDEESSSDEDDDEDLLENDDTDKVLEALVRIKRKDPVVYQKDVVLFPEEEAEAAAAQAAANGKRDKSSSKPVYLRTVLAKQALEGGAASSDEDEEGDGSGEAIPKQPVSHSYAAEQQELKKAFLQAAEQALDDQEGEDAAAKGLIKRRKVAGAAGDNDEAADGAGKEQQVNELLDEYFGRDADLTEADAFLKNYLANKAWKEPSDAAAGAGRKRLRSMGDDDHSSSASGSEDEGGEGADGLAVDEEEDEQFLEEVDRFEAAYNFRFEEPNSHRIQSFPRVIEDSVRRPDERRKRQRQAKAERKAAEKEEREAELRRLKNLKKEEINDMLARIEKEAGIRTAAKPAAAAAADSKAAAKGNNSSSSSGKGGAKFAGLLDELLEGDFDPEEYDRRMAEAFDDEYYEGEEDAHELFGDAEEELADEADVEAVTDPESANAASSFAALRQKLKQQQAQNGADDGTAGSDEDAEQQGGSSDDEEDGGDGKGSKAERVAKHAEQRSQLQRLLEDYYKLDYEDNIGGLACRFKYREVPAESFGLTDEDVLALSDKQLNQIAGLRLLAPYREDSKRLRPNYKALQSIKGEAAAAAALRRQKKEREKQKQLQKSKQPKQQQGDEQQQQQDRYDGKGKQQHQQQHGQKKQKFQQQGQRSQHPQHHQQQHRHKPQQQQQQQKALADMTAEEKQAARMASYAKLTLKPSKQAQQQAEGLAGTAGGAGKGSKKRRADQQQGEEGGVEQQRKKQKGPAVQPGRLAAAGVQLEAPLTKAQKKNLLRALKRKEKQQAQGNAPAADA